MLNIAGAILAGGQSSRMGGDKATLSFQGTTLLKQMESLLQRSGIKDIYISRSNNVPEKSQAMAL
jgi:molybdenum cofactor guanylyltransferase